MYRRKAEGCLTDHAIRSIRVKATIVVQTESRLDDRKAARHVVAIKTRIFCRRRTRLPLLFSKEDFHLKYFTQVDNWVEVPETMTERVST